MTDEEMKMYEDAMFKALSGQPITEDEKQCISEQLEMIEDIRKRMDRE